MSLDKGIKYCKEHRKPYYGSDAFDYTCRPNGGCPHCEHNRIHSTKRRQLASDIGDQLNDYEQEIRECCDENN